MKPALPLLAFATALAAAVPVWAFYPGLLDADGLSLYAAALLGLPVPDWHSPLLALAWRGLIALGTGPAFIVAIQSASWFVAFSALLWRHRAPAWLVFVPLAFPPLLPWLASIEKTSFCGVMLALCLPAMVVLERTRRWPWAVPLAAFGLAGCLARPNAIVLFLPLAAFAAWRLGGRAWAGAVLLAALVLAAPPLARVAGLSAPAHPEQATMDLDLFNLSLRTGEDLFPPGVLAETLPDAAARLDQPPWSGLGLSSFSILPLEQTLAFQPDGPAFAALRDAWLGAILAHPGAYLRYRLEFSAAFACVDFAVPCPFGWHWNNGGIDPNPFGLFPAPNPTVFALWRWLLDTWVFRPVVLAALVAAAGIAALARRRPLPAAFAAVLLLMFASNMVLAPGPTPRYSAPFGLLLPLLAVEVLAPKRDQAVSARPSALLR